MDVLIFKSTNGRRVALPVGKICCVREVHDGCDILIDGGEHGAVFSVEAFDAVVAKVESAFAAIRANRKPTS